MALTRMSLSEAAKALEIAPNSVRSRFKSGKLRGERDNSGKIWVWIDPENLPTKASKSQRSKPSIEGSKAGEIEALKSHIQTLKEQLAHAQSEVAILSEKAARVDRLEATLEASQILERELRQDRDQWRETVEHLIQASQRRWWQVWKK